MSNATPSGKRRANETPEQREKRLAYHREYMRQWRAKHPEKTKEASARYFSKNRDKVREQARARYLKNRDSIIASVCEYSKRNRQKINARIRQRHREDPEKRRAASREQYRKRSEHSRQVQRRQRAAYMRMKRNSDPAFLVADRLRRRINAALKSNGSRKLGTLVDVSGCTVRELVAHIEKQFLPGMTWENRWQWHIDHIVPCSAFDLTDLAQQQVAFHYTNLRPVWASDNLRKHAKVPGGQKQFLWTERDVRRASKRASKTNA